MRKLLLAGSLAFLLKLALAVSTAGTNDALTWEHDLTTLRTSGFAELYRSGVQYASPAGPQSQRQVFIHPPAVLHVLPIIGNRFWLRASCAVADAGTLALLWLMFGRIPLILVLSPISILISGFHGNTDPIMMFFLVASVYFAERGDSTRSGFAFGLACSVKLVPLIFGPAIVLFLPGIRPRLKWLFASAGIWTALSLPYLAQEPAPILKSMLGYSGATGLWGFGLFSTLLDAGRIYDPAAKWIALLAAASAPVFMKRRLFTQCGLVVFLFLALSPGFGLQYLAWTVPRTIVLQRRTMAAYHVIAGFVVLTVYTAALENTSGGVYANLLNPEYFPVVILMGIVGWITIAGITWRWARNTETLGVAQNPVPPARPGDRESIAAVRDY